MTPLDCFIRKIGAGIVSKDAGARLIETIDAFEKEYAKRRTKADAARAAAADAADEAATLAARKAELALGNIEAQLNVLKGAHAYTEALGDLRDANKAPLWLKDPRKSPLAHFARSLLTRDPAEIANWGNVYYQARNIRGQAHAMFREGIAAMRPTWFGMKPNRVTELEVLQAIKNPRAQVSDQARALAARWADTAEFLRKMYVDARGALPYRKDWGLPNPVHDTLKIRSIDKADWMAFVKPLLDRKAMLDFETGKWLSEDRIDTLLGEMYDTVAAGGADGPPSAVQRGQGALAGRRAHARFLVFRNAEAWLDYDAKFGSGAGVFQTMMDHIDGMADDIAMLQILGPNPEATKRFILSLFDREGARLAHVAKMAAPGSTLRAALTDNTAVQSYINTGRRSFENLWSEITGANKIPVHLEAAYMLAELRAAMTASKMGSAILSSIVDPALLVMTARFNGMPVMAPLRRAIEGMATQDFELQAVQLGMVADSVAYSLHQQDRFMGETIRTGRMSQLATAVIGASGLRRWSGVLRASFGMEFMAHGANRLNDGFDALPEWFRAALNRYGLSPADWDIIRRATPTEPKPGGKFLTAADIRAVEGGAGRIADSWQRLIDTEMDYAVIEGDPITRAFMLGDSQPGTIGGEARRIGGQFKAFPITLVNTAMARFAARGVDADRMSHGALTLLAMWGMGMVSMQAKEIVKGRDPVTMDPTTPNGARAWGVALLQSGGLGIFGDLIGQDQTRQGTSFAGMLGGPLLATGDKVLGDVLFGNITRAARGQETHFLGDALYAGAALLPGSNLWYARTAFQRAVLDQLALMADERAPERFQRIQKEAEKSWGQRFWWEPGAPAAQRGPDLTAAFGR